MVHGVQELGVQMSSWLVVSGVCSTVQCEVVCIHHLYRLHSYNTYNDFFSAFSIVSCASCSSCHVLSVVGQLLGMGVLAWGFLTDDRLFYST